MIKRPDRLVKEGDHSNDNAPIGLDDRWTLNGKASRPKVAWVDLSDANAGARLSINSDRHEVLAPVSVKCGGGSKVPASSPTE